VNKEYLELIDELNELTKDNTVILSVASTMLAVTAVRIFDDGLAADGSPIGQYSTKPISVSRKRQSRKTRSTYFKEGWKQYKQETGHDPNKVNLVDSGQMRDDWSIVEEGNNTIGLGFKNELNSLKADGNEKRFGKEIFAHGPEEDEVFDKVFQVELDRVFGK
jgi:hypothetical protein